jgi:hypothetical protein
VRDGLADHPQACYGGSVGKSIKGVIDGIWKKVRNIAIDQLGNFG